MFGSAPNRGAGFLRFCSITKALNALCGNETMKAFRSFPTGWLLVTGLIIGLHFLHAQHAVIPVQYGAALPVVTKVNDAEVVQSLTAASRQIIYSLPAGDENDRGKFAPAFNFSTDSLWLQITGITNGMASLILNNATNQVYDGASC